MSQSAKEEFKDNLCTIHFFKIWISHNLPKRNLKAKLSSSTPTIITSHNLPKRNLKQSVIGRLTQETGIGHNLPKRNLKFALSKLKILNKSRSQSAKEEFKGNFFLWNNYGLLSQSAKEEFKLILWIVLNILHISHNLPKRNLNTTKLKN